MLQSNLPKILYGGSKLCSKMYNKVLIKERSLTLNSVPKMSQLKSEKRSRGGEMSFALCVQIACMKSAWELLLKCMSEAEGWKNPSAHEEELWCLRMCVWLNHYLGVGWHKIGRQAGSRAVFGNYYFLSNVFSTQTLLFGTIYIAKEEGGLKGSGRTAKFQGWATMQKEVMETIETKPPGTGTGKISIPGENGL